MFKKIKVYGWSGKCDDDRRQISSWLTSIEAKAQEKNCKGITMAKDKRNE